MPMQRKADTRQSDRVRSMAAGFNPPQVIDSRLRSFVSIDFAASHGDNW